MINKTFIYPASFVAWLPVNIQLEILVSVKETASGLVHQKMVGIFLRNQVGVVSVTQRRLDFNHLSRYLSRPKEYAFNGLIYCSVIK